MPSVGVGGRKCDQLWYRVCRSPRKRYTTTTTTTTTRTGITLIVLYASGERGNQKLHLLLLLLFGNLEGKQSFLGHWGFARRRWSSHPRAAVMFDDNKLVVLCSGGHCVSSTTREGREEEEKEEEEDLRENGGLM